MKRLFVYFVLPIVILAQSCTNKDSLTHIKVAQYGDVFLYAPLYIADDRGFFAEEGIKIKLINTGGDQTTYDLVCAGSAIFGVADPTFVAIKGEQGIEGRVIGGIVNGVPFEAITKKKEIPLITDATMLSPYRVATFPAPSTAYAVQKKMFLEAGLKPNIIEGDAGTLIPMLDAERADIALELEPNVSSEIHKNGARIVYSLNDYYSEFAFTGITTTMKTIETKPELVQHFINAINRAEMYIHQYPDSAAFYLSKRFHDNDNSYDIIKDAIIRMVSTNTIPENAIITREAWQNAVDLRVYLEHLKSANNVFHYLDMSFVEQAILTNNYDEWNTN